MNQLKNILKKVPGMTVVAKKARLVFRLFEYQKALSRIKNTKKMILKRYTSNPDKKIVVAFIIQFIPSWNKLKPIYDKLINNTEFEVLLLCVPSLLNENRVTDTSLNTNVNDTFVYFASQGYDCIDAYSDGRWFNLEDYSPDYVFHSRPYNHFMPEQYKSAEISKYALICNVMYAASLIYNDQEIAFNYDYFKDVYCYFAFDRFEKDFYQKRFYDGIKRGIQKCYGYGATGLEQVLKEKTKRKENNYFKKVVIWTPRWSTDSQIGGSNFFRYKELIETLIEEYHDVLFIIRPHPLMFGNFVKTGEMSEQDVVVFKRYCKDRFNVWLDEEKEYVETFWQSDFLISDLSGIVPEYYVTQKPIIYCNSKADFIYLDYALEMFKHSYVVDNSKELLESFELIYNNNDYKQIDRRKSIYDIFGDFQKSSDEIVKILKLEMVAKKSQR